MCEHCDWEKLLEAIEEMLEEPRYEFAVDTIEGIKEWVLEREHCTAKQIEAIKNIRESMDV